MVNICRARDIIYMTYPQFTYVQNNLPGVIGGWNYLLGEGKIWVILFSILSYFGKNETESRLSVWDHE